MRSATTVLINTMTNMGIIMLVAEMYKQTEI